MTGEAKEIVAVAMASAEPREIDPEKTYLVVTAENGMERVDPAPDGLLAHPRRPAGTSTVFDVDSLKLLWDKHASPTSELFADPNAFILTGVLNADAGLEEPAGHRDHRVVMKCQLTVAWQTWLALDGKLMGQAEFAEHIEDRVIDITTPSGADMLELAQSIQATQTADFKSSALLSNGVRGIRYEVDQTASAGQNGQLEIPTSFELGLQPFVGGDRYKVSARFRFRIREGHLFLSYKLDRPEDVLETAFKGVQEAASEATGSLVLLGSAPPSR